MIPVGDPGRVNGCGLEAVVTAPRHAVIWRLIASAEPATHARTGPSRTTRRGYRRGAVHAGDLGYITTPGWGPRYNGRSCRTGRRLVDPDPERRNR